MAKPEIKPIWTSSSFLVYAGGLTVLAGAIAGLKYLATQYSDSGAMAAWALLFLVILYGKAHALRRKDRWLAAGIFAFVSVIAWAFFVFFMLEWWGGNVEKSFSVWSWPRTIWIVLVLVSAWVGRRQFRFPFIRSISAVFFFLLVISVLPEGRNLTYVWALLVGLFYLLMGNVIDRPSAFWLHVVAGALIGGAFLHWFHNGDGEFAVVCIVALVFVFIANWTKRSVWAVYGTIGFFAATIHYVGLVISPLALLGSGLGSGLPAFGSTAGGVFVSTGPVSPWAPALGFGLLGFWLVLLGMLGKRRRKAAAVVVTTVVTAPPAA